MARFTVDLQPDEREALLRLSHGKRRDPRQQAALIIRDGLQRAGLLPSDTPTPATPTTTPRQAAQPRPSTRRTKTTTQ